MECFGLLSHLQPSKLNKSKKKNKKQRISINRFKSYTDYKTHHSFIRFLKF